MIYILNGINDIKFEDYILLREYTSQNRLKKADSYISKYDKIRCIISFLLLRFGLFYEYNIDKMPEIRIGYCGKPFLNNMSNLYFNFSHSNNVIVCGLDSDPLGIDVEEKIFNSKKIYRFVLSTGELEKYSTELDPDDYFTYIWTLKESYIKQNNSETLFSLQNIDFSMFKDDCFSFKDLLFQIKKYENFYLSICAKKNMEIIQIQLITLISFLKNLNCV